jgi:clan AA aspartic protease
MGLVMVRVTLSNQQDVVDAASGRIPASAIRRVEIDALADTGAIGLAIPEEVAQALGALVVRERTVRVADGRSVRVSAVGALHIAVLGRDMLGEAIVLPAGATPLLGAIQLEYMDLVVVPSTGEVVPNPAHPDGPVLPLLRAS